MLLFLVTIGFLGSSLTDEQLVYRFIRTGIISGAALEKLQASNMPFAEVEDAAAAVLLLASNKTFNGELRLDLLLRVDS